MASRWIRPRPPAPQPPDETPFEAGLMFAVKLDKPSPFIGRDALLAAQGRPLRKKLVTIVLAALIGLFSLRVRTIFFAMITLAVASAFLILASQLSDITGGEDGLNYRLPVALRASFRPVEGVTGSRAVRSHVPVR